MTGPGSTFSWPVTLNVYEVGPGNAVGPQIATATQTLAIPYRRTAKKKCPLTSEGQGWGPSCLLGKLQKFHFHLAGVTLPETAIVAVAFDTEGFGAHPTGVPGPYNSLNVSVSSSYKYNQVTQAFEFSALPVTEGQDPLPEDAYLSSTWGGAYCDGGASGTGTFRLDTGCWTGFQPELQVKAVR